MLELPFDVVHKHEKNFEGQQHLDAHREDFNADAWTVLMMLLDGQRLNNPALSQAKITLSLSSRISELRKSNYKVAVNKEWFKDDNGKRIYMEYFLMPPEIERILKLIVSRIRFKKNHKESENLV